MLFPSIGFLTGGKDNDLFLVPILIQQPVNIRQLRVWKIQYPLTEFRIKFCFLSGYIGTVFSNSFRHSGKADLDGII